MSADREGGRRAARRQAVVLLYQHDVTGLGLEELERNAARDGTPVDPFARALMEGVAADPASLDELVKELGHHGEVHVQERTEDTIHMLWNGTKVSAFVLEPLAAHVEDRHLDVTGVLATKLHAILDRGLRRDFFDLYVMLETERLGIVAALGALRAVYQAPVDDGLLLRALTYFNDADREAPLPGEGAGDWKAVKDYFLVQVGSLLVPPGRRLAIQAHTVDLLPGP